MEELKACPRFGNADIKVAVMALDIFCKNWCIKADSTDLIFNCDNCNFSNGDKCLVKCFKCDKMPDYKEFGSMGDL